MMNTPTGSRGIALFCALLASACISFAQDQPQTSTFTDWMPRYKFLEYLDAKGKKGEDGKNYWDQGYWIDAVECKWEDGYQKYRIAVAPAPKGKPHWWLWYFDMSQDFFEKRLTENSIQGYQLVHVHKCLNPSDVTAYAAVWHKVDEGTVRQNPPEAADK
jgi:hypothetical protein